VRAVGGITLGYAAFSPVEGTGYFLNDISPMPGQADGQVLGGKAL
jgi:hypothetical protein